MKLISFPSLTRPYGVLHNVSMEHNEWLKTLPGAPSITSAARTAKLQKTTLMRQLDRGVIPPENVIALARAYRVSIIDALVDTGHINEDEVKIVGVVKALGYATNEQILDEMMRRVDPQAVRLFQGDEDTITPSFDAKVHQFPTPDVQPEPYAAKRKKPEPSEGDDDYGPGA